MIVEVLRTAGVGRDERQVDVGLLRAGELDLRLLGGFLQALQRHPVLAQIDAFALLELVGQPVDDDLVEVVAAEVGVAVGGEHLEDAVGEIEDRDVVGAAAEVVDGDFLVALLLETVGQGRGGRLVDDALDVETGDLAGVLGRLALRVVEVGRDGDHGAVDLVAEIGLGVGLQLLQNHRGDFLAGCTSGRPS